MRKILPKKALLVDGPEDRRVFRRFLQLHGFEIKECDTLEEAIPLVTEFLPDLMVTDFSKAVDPALGRCRGAVDRLPVLFHGGLLPQWEEMKSMASTKAAFLSRPFSLLDFHIAIQGLLRS